MEDALTLGFLALWRFSPTGGRLVVTTRVRSGHCALLLALDLALARSLFRRKAIAKRRHDVNYYKVDVNVVLRYAVLW